MVPVGISALLAALALLAYLVVLVRLALAAGGFARYLKEREFEAEDESEEESLADPIVAREY